MITCSTVISVDAHLTHDLCMLLGTIKPQHVCVCVCGNWPSFDKMAAWGSHALLMTISRYRYTRREFPNQMVDGVLYGKRESFPITPVLIHGGLVCPDTNHCGHGSPLHPQHFPSTLHDRGR